MPKIDFPVAVSDGQEFTASTGVVYTYVGTPPNGYWSAEVNTGGGGNQNLQSVTDEGNTTTNGATFGGQVIASTGIEFGDGTTQTTAASGGGTQNLQSVTDEGNTTTNGATFAGDILTGDFSPYGTKVKGINGITIRTDSNSAREVFGIFDEDNSSAEKVAIKADGSATFAGTVTSGPVGLNSANAFTIYKADGSSGIIMTNAGTASFDGTVDVGTGSISAANGEGLQLWNDGCIYVRSTTNNIFWRGFDGTTNTETSLINRDGSASFAKDVTINTVTVGMGGGSISTNTALGNGALFNTTTGSQNTAVGQAALYTNTEGTYNTALGRETLSNNTTGTLNIGLGYAAMLQTSTGSSNIAIGGVDSSGGYSPVFNITAEDNRIVMGSTSVTDAYIQVAWTVTSDARDKTSFASVPYGLDFVKQLQPTAYQFKAGNRNARDPETNELIPATAADELPSGPVRYGFKAQDILALEGDNPVIIDNENPDHLKYRGEALVPVLVNAIKEQQVLIDALTARVTALEASAN